MKEANHERYSRARNCVCQATSCSDVLRQRLFAQHGNAATGSCYGRGTVHCRWRADTDRLELLLSQHFFVIRINRQVAPSSDGLPRIWINVGNRNHLRSSFVIRPDMYAPDATGSDYAYPYSFSHA